MIGDIVASEDETEASLHNALETLRDPTHTRCLPESESLSVIEITGFHVEAVESWDNRRTFSGWAATVSKARSLDPLLHVMKALANSGAHADIEFTASAAGAELTHHWRFVHAIAKPPPRRKALQCTVQEAEEWGARGSLELLSSEGFWHSLAERVRRRLSVSSDGNPREQALLALADLTDTRDHVKSSPRPQESRRPTHPDRKTIRHAVVLAKRGIEAFAGLAQGEEPSASQAEGREPRASDECARSDERGAVFAESRLGEPAHTTSLCAESRYLLRPSNGNGCPS